MIIVKIKAGLGNQMFQYACGRAMALRNHDILKLDVTDYAVRNNDPYYREFDLDKFNIQKDIAADSEIDALKPAKPSFLNRAVRAVSVRSGLQKIVDDLLDAYNVGFKPEVLEKRGDIYLDGYWQDERYFSDHADAIRKDLSLREPPGKEAGEILDDIASGGIAISVQVRRGDNAHNPSSMEKFGMPEDRYYTDAVKHILGEEAKRSSRRSARVYVFSDEIDWVRENVDFGLPTTYVTRPEIRLWEELPIMSACGHHVISNSTFGWWGAWLDSSPDKIVVAPKRWMRKGNHLYNGLIPGGWIRL